MIYFIMIYYLTSHALQFNRKKFSIHSDDLRAVDIKSSEIDNKLMTMLKGGMNELISNRKFTAHRHVSWNILVHLRLTIVCAYFRIKSQCNWYRKLFRITAIQQKYFMGKMRKGMKVFFNGISNFASEFLNDFFKIWTSTIFIFKISVYNFNRFKFFWTNLTLKILI